MSSVTGPSTDSRSRIGLSTYALFWELSDRVPDPLSLADAVDRTRELGLGLLQICDYAPLETLDEVALKELRGHADARGVALEVGTKGIRPARLRRFLHIAHLLGATVVRSMLNTPEPDIFAGTGGPGHAPSVAEAVTILRELIGEYEEAGVKLALETYEQVPTADLLAVVRAVGSPNLGICSDPANSVAALENPRAVVESVAPHVLNMHIKDFAFARQDGWVGFVYSGAPMGEGLLDYDHLAAAIRPAENNINQIIEHWLPWQGTPEETVRIERRWTDQAIEYLRSKGNA
ncbi:sugar phosphate isomerase/epimerase family protein [Sinomonas terrae]|uniref:Sugar phosphate isomerase/epimerase n=1 Tax=Sinomonas terrae TaxID=2908838 RepID=A0ABS9U6Z8_9MICC|nr:TIM barrel protein [Sinomonas terrae]MCH6472137.1 sugar phosphate isomerase/epimerase [Sinomonas terrae]